MDLVALGTWMIAVLLGFFLLDTWLPEAGVKPTDKPAQRPASSTFDNLLAGTHMLCATVGWLVWMVFTLGHSALAGRIALVLVILTALLGVSMMSRWLPARLRAGRLSRAAGLADPPANPLSDLQPIPLSRMLGHGLFAVATVALVAVTVLLS